MTPEELRRIRASLATTATSGVYMGAVLADIVALLAEVDRFRKLFDDAGQGEHNMLALVEHYQSEMMKAQEQVSGIAAILGDAGCDCDDEDEDEDARYRCLAHRIQDVLQPEFRVRT